MKIASSRAYLLYVCAAVLIGCTQQNPSYQACGAQGCTESDLSSRTTDFAGGTPDSAGGTPDFAGGTPDLAARDGAVGRPDLSQPDLTPAPLSIAVTAPQIAECAGAGIITSAGAGIACGANFTSCDATLPAGSTVRLTATMFPGASLVRWTGDCAAAGASSTCMLSGSGPKTVGIDIAIEGLLTVSGSGGSLWQPAPPMAAGAQGFAVGTGACTAGKCCSLYTAGTQVRVDAGRVVNWTGPCTISGGGNRAMVCPVQVNSKVAVSF